MSSQNFLKSKKYANKKKRLASFVPAVNAIKENITEKVKIGAETIIQSPEITNNIIALRKDETYKLNTIFLSSAWQVN